MLPAEDIGDGHRGHGSGQEGGVSGLIGEVVTGDVGTIAGESDDLDVDQSVLVDEFRQAECRCRARTHRGEQQIGLGQKSFELPRSSTVLEVDGADLLSSSELLVVVGVQQVEGIAAGRLDLDHPGAERVQACGSQRAGQIDGERDHRDSGEWLRCSHSWILRSNRILVLE